MRNVVLCLVVLTILVGLMPAAKAQAPAAAPAVPSQTPPPATGRKKRVAIFDFDYATVHSSVAALFGQDVDVGKGISDLLVTDLVKDGSYSVIERKALDKILKEQNFSNSDRADPNSAAKIGKLLGVDAIIVGSITQFGNETKNTNIGEYVKFQLRVEAFNIANHPNFNAIGTNIDSSSFGQVTTDHEPRLLQMGGKFTF